MTTKAININELITILEKHYNKRIHINKFKVAGQEINAFGFPITFELEFGDLK